MRHAKLTILATTLSMLLSAASWATQQTKIPDFHFPKILGRTTAIERMEPPTTGFDNLGLPPDEALEMRKRMEAGMRAHKALFADMEKDVNAAAKHVLENISDSDSMLLCKQFCTAITFRVPNEKGFAIKPVAIELKKFCETAIALAAKEPNLWEGSILGLRQTILHCYLELGDDKSAKTLAKQILADNADRDYFSDGLIVHDENMILAEIAFREKNLTESCSRLKMAGQSKGAPTLNSFGPNFPIILDLLKAGKREEVLDYLKGIQKFWHGAPVDDWIKTIKSGSLPQGGDYWRWGTSPYRPFHQ